MTSTSIRTARPDELATVYAVDDDATRKYPEAGITIELAPDHPFVVSEHRRWAAAIEEGRVFVAERDHRVVGFAVLDVVDGAPYLDQISVCMDSMGRGVGRALLARAIEWAEGPLWLTTYDHVPWNRPYYERAGFTLVPEREWDEEMRAIIASQRASLPFPEARVVMRRP